ncbi:hypothetical protein HDU76_005652 [Blyttiomyces sp. JEL0837]|nr:hypothetical protein HDU76_005652 [Blyttiomyces sp. JEL0837]
MIIAITGLTSASAIPTENTSNAATLNTSNTTEPALQSLFQSHNIDITNTVFMSTNNINTTLSSFASAALCAADAAGFNFDMNNCVPGILSATGRVSLSSSQISCLCNSNAGVDLTNGLSDCTGSDRVAVVNYAGQYFKLCPYARTVGTTTVPPRRGAAAGPNTVSMGVVLGAVAVAFITMIV